MIPLKSKEPSGGGGLLRAWRGDSIYKAPRWSDLDPLALQSWDSAATNIFATSYLLSTSSTLGGTEEAAAIRKSFKIFLHQTITLIMIA